MWAITRAGNKTQVRVITKHSELKQQGWGGAGLDKTGQDKTRQGWIEQDKTRQDETGLNRTGQDRTGQTDRTGQRLVHAYGNRALDYRALSLYPALGITTLNLLLRRRVYSATGTLCHTLSVFKAHAVTVIVLAAQSINPAC